jgi:hypothetical protein
MFWLGAVVVVLGGGVVVRRVLRRRRAPVFDQDALKNANYDRVSQDVTNFDRRFGHYGG